jgi:hypothetical protein
VISSSNVPVNQEKFAAGWDRIFGGKPVSSAWTMPEWMEMEIGFLGESKAEVERRMTGYGALAASLLASDAGRQIEMNSKVGLLCDLRHADRLKPVVCTLADAEPDNVVCEFCGCRLKTGQATYCAYCEEMLKRQERREDV